MMATYDEERLKILERPNISRNDLREAAKLLPKLLLFTNEEIEERTTVNSTSSQESLKEDHNPQSLNKEPILLNEPHNEEAKNSEQPTEQPVTVKKTLPHSYNNDRRTSISKNSLTVPLCPSVFSLENIPSPAAAAQKHTHYDGDNITSTTTNTLIPTFEVSDESLWPQKRQPVMHSKEVKWSSSQQTTNTNNTITTSKESTVPKLPQIKTIQGPIHTLTLHKNIKGNHHHKPIQHNDSSLHSHNSLNGTITPLSLNSNNINSNNNLKPMVPLQLQNVRQQLQEQIENSTRSVYPGMTGWSRSRERTHSHPITKGHPMRSHHLSLSPSSNSILPYTITAIPLTKQQPKGENIQVDTNYSRSAIAPIQLLKPPPSVTTFDYLRKSSKKVVFKKVNNSHTSDQPKETVIKEKEPIKEEKNVNDSIIGEEKDHSYLVEFNREDVDEKSKTIINKFRGGVINKLNHLTDDVHKDYDAFLSEVDTVTYYAQRQAEVLLKDYSPRTVMLISSAVPKAEMLRSATRPEVLSLVYDVTTETYSSLLSKLKALLDSYMVGAKAKYLAVICKGGPGYMYLLQSKPITPPKLLKEEALLKFWKDVGGCMSKISTEEQPIIHLMECNVAGNRQGTELLSNLEAAMYGHRVKAESPLELEPKGRQMIALYFYPEKFKTWKSRRYTKVKLF